MAKRNLSFSGVRSLAVGMAALWFTACSSSEGGPGSGGSAPGTGGFADSSSTGSGGTTTGGTTTGGTTTGGTTTGGTTTGGTTTGGNAAGGNASAGTTGVADAGAGGTSVSNGGQAGRAGSSSGGSPGAGQAGGGGAAGARSTGGGGAGAGGSKTATGGAAGSPGGNGGATGTGGGSSGAGGTAGACQRGQVAANEVLIVGDSYFPAAGGELVKELRRLSGANYRDRSVGGAKMNAIVAQYENAGAPQPKVVIMDGGGNDILQNPGCAPGCAQHMQAVTDARNFFKQMAMDGVRDVVFIFYYDMPVMKAGLDWMRPRMAAECQQSPVPCHFVDNQPLFAGMDAATYTTDGIHPTAAAADIIARQVWERMQKDCVAQ